MNIVTRFSQLVGITSVFMSVSCNMAPQSEKQNSLLHGECQGEGPPVLLLHGFGASTYSWRYLIDDLAHSHRVFAIDLKGFGKSPKPDDEDYSIFDQARLVCKMIEDEDLHDLTVIGHSYGGGVALATTVDLLQRTDTRISNLVLIDSIAYPQTLPTFIKVARTPVIGYLGMHLLSNKSQVKRILELAYCKDDRITNDQIAAYAAPLALPGAKRAIRTVADQLIPPNFEDFISRYKDIDIPTLLIWGRHDKIVPLEIGERLNAVLPQSQLVIVEDCGHIPQEEKPRETLREIQQFLSKER